MAEEVEIKSPSPSPLECPVCLQKAVQPIKLPCNHIFCFLCVKGASAQNQACPMCRRPISRGYLDSPDVLALEEEGSVSKGHAWFYEGRDGWWRYDERTSLEMENIYLSLSKGSDSQDEEEATEDKTSELLIAGFIYVIDFENQVQYRKNYPGRRRKIKRDVFDAPSKGVAGLHTTRALSTRGRRRSIRRLRPRK
ncbi:E3 ubiquitin-protein ligase rnf146 [Lepeophtheirus salmonis]|uniref:E3 ubiquitin-protein ligase rnf146 n=1 Tax=Lepeophtheirus salmonis TaxID=72036 RepID=UPI001AEA90CC|nr:E3 ubiquitin-protein ligase rnf146-like [Lepeophtheirus salmonis]